MQRSERSSASPRRSYIISRHGMSCHTMHCSRRSSASPIAEEVTPCHVMPCHEWVDRTAAEEARSHRRGALRKRGGGARGRRERLSLAAQRKRSSAPGSPSRATTATERHLRSCRRVNATVMRPPRARARPCLIGERVRRRERCHDVSMECRQGMSWKAMECLSMPCNIDM